MSRVRNSHRAQVLDNQPSVLHMKRPRIPAHIQLLESNAAEVARLVDIHVQLVGQSPGRKYHVEVLNKSAIVLLVACWEYYVESLATNAFDTMFRSAKEPSVFPNKVLSIAGSQLRSDKNEIAIWKLAGKGWKGVLSSHREALLDKYVGRLNTPKPDQINTLFETLIGLKTLTHSWSYPGMSTERCEAKLCELVELRGDIAHKVTTEASVHKSKVIDYTYFIKKLAGISSNQVGEYVRSRTGRRPWYSNIDYSN